MNELLKIQNLSISFADNPPVVKDASFVLHSGEILGIVGESGSGKTLTALSILGLLPPQARLLPESSIRFENMELINAQAQTLRKLRGGQVGFIFQEPMSSLNPLHTIGAQIAETLIIHQKLKPGEAKARVKELLQLVEINERYDAYPYELSGGQRQRVMIAMAIANNPQVLIADEPTTALDVTVQEQIIKLLLDLRQKLNIAIIFITHDLRLIQQIADRVIVMNKGKIVEQNTTEAIFNNPQDCYTKKLINSFTSLKSNKNASGEVFVKVDGLHVTYPLKKNFWGRVTQSLNAVDNVNFELRQGETLGIVGESGSGKTTLGLCLANLLKFKGNVSLSKAVSKKDFHRKVQIVFQDPYNSLNPRLNILEIVGEGLKIHFPKLSNKAIQQKVTAMLQETGLSEKDLYKYPHQFSGGQRQRIAIARALIIEPELVILDEPTSALDVTVQAQIIKLLKQLQTKLNMTYVFISHDMRAVKIMADRIAVMKQGKILEIDSTENIFDNPCHPYTKALIEASLLSPL